MSASASKAPCAAGAALSRAAISDVLEAYVEHKRDEVDDVRLRPHPWEFALYLDA